MRMRKKPNLLPRMEKASAVLTARPEALRGKWLVSFPGHSRLHLELGCGKGGFTCAVAAAMPDTLLAAVEKVPDAMVVAMERVMERNIPNVRFLDRDAGLLPELFAPGEIARLYINFCDPWPKSRDAKLRLTAPGYLRLYADLLPVGGQIWFKTDNTPLFDWSIRQMEAEGWSLTEVTHDLHAAGPVGVMTDYEARFYDLGQPINRLVAARNEYTLTTAAGPVPRLRNASLSDARGAEESADAARG
jgi:tRNA (guanine-N7-)-methyltransferase